VRLMEPPTPEMYLPSPPGSRCVINVCNIADISIRLAADCNDAAYAQHESKRVRFYAASVWAMLLELRSAKIAKSEAFTSLIIVDDLYDAVDCQAYSSDREHKRHDLPARLHVKLQLPRKMGLPE
jgi:hypothetical protein